MAEVAAGVAEDEEEEDIQQQQLLPFRLWGLEVAHRGRR